MAREPTEHPVQGAGCSRGAHVFPPPGWQLQLFLEQVRGQRPQALRPPHPPHRLQESGAPQGFSRAAG